MRPTLEFNGHGTFTTANAIAFQPIVIDGLFDKIGFGNGLQQYLLGDHIGSLNKLLMELLLNMKKISSATVV